MDMFGIGLDLMAILITFIILVGVLLGKKNAMNEYFPILLLMNAMTLLADMGTHAFCGSAEYLLFMKICVIAQGSFAYVSLAGFNLYVDKLLMRKIGKKPAYRVVPFLLMVVMILFWISSLMHGLAYTISDDGVYSRGEWFILCIFVPALVPLFDFVRVMVNHIKENIEKDVALALYMFVLIPFLALPIAIIINCMSLFFAVFTMSYLIMYIAIHVHSEQVIVEKKMDDTIMQTDLTISQMNPHFMFNSLTNIKYLIRKKPEIADAAIDKFILYLRRILDSIQNPAPISFAEEIDHTKVYLWLEQVRFADLKVDYSIDADDFLVPPLTLQPIVENAVKHGVTKKVGGGTVTISVREMSDCYKITVKDDGVGFDMNDADYDEDQQVGIKDIRKRLMEMNKSTLSISSTPGVGTTAIYKIMKEE